MNDIEKLDALGREYGIVIYAIHQARAGWGCQWYDGIADLTATPNEWQKHLAVYGYYPTIAEMVKAETERIKSTDSIERFYADSGLSCMIQSMNTTATDQAKALSQWLGFSDLAVLENYLAPCIECNDEHRGMTVEAKGHEHSGVHGVGFIRLLVIGNGKVEFCFRCSCAKSGYKNVSNDTGEHCADKKCPCHLAAVAY